MSADMRLRGLYEIPENSIGEDWNRLVWTMESPQVFYTHEWALAVSRAYAYPRPLLFTAYRGESLVGVAALAVGEHNEASFLCGSTADYCDFVSAPSEREELIALVMSELHALGITTLRLANLPADSVSSKVFRTAARAAGYSTFERPAYFCAQIAMDSSEQRRQIAQSAKRRLKKAGSMAARLGEITVAHRKSWEEFVKEFDDYATASVARFLAAGQTSSLLQSERRAFMAELAKLLSARGWLTFSTLGISGKTVAWHYGFQFAGTWFYYAPSFDTDLSQLGPGAYLFRQILETAAQDPETHVVDLGLGDENYKQPYSRNGRRTVDIVASQSGVRILQERARFASAQAIKRLPKLEHRVRRLVAGTSAAQARFAKHGALKSGISFCKSAWKRVAQRDEVFFLEARSPAANHMGLTAIPLSMKLLATIAMKNPEDRETLEYVQRSAARLQRTNNFAYGLVDAHGEPAHVCWIAPFEGFRPAGMKHGLRAPAADSEMLFDPWTCGPQSNRSPQFSAMIAAQAVNIGKRPWICTSSSQVTSLEAAGFVCRFSLARRSKFKKVLSLEFGNATQQVGLGPAA